MPSNEESSWCPGAESNHRHCDFQSHALPTELPGHFADRPARERGFIVGLRGSVHHASPFGLRVAQPRGTRRAMRARHGPKGGDGRKEPRKQLKSRLFGVFLVVFGRRHDVGIRQPAVQVDIPTALGTERARGHTCRLAANRTGLCGGLVGLAAPGMLRGLSRHSTNRSESENLRRRAGSPLHRAATRPRWSRSLPS